MKFISALLLAIALTFAPINGISREFSDVKITLTDEYSQQLTDAQVTGLVWKAYLLMQKHYGEHFPGLKFDFPTEIIFGDWPDSGFAGCYSTACALELEGIEISDEEFFKYFTDPVLIEKNPVFVNFGLLFQIDPEHIQKTPIFVLAHEIGHHVLTRSGMDIMEQHKNMFCGPDLDMEKELGIDFGAKQMCEFHKFLASLNSDIE